MIPQLAKYFRFVSKTETDGTTYYVPYGFNIGADRTYGGYDMAPYVIKYLMTRDIDLSPDTFTITVSNDFFAEYNFEPTSNDAVIIGPYPEKEISGTWDVSTGTLSYCYEDLSPEMSSPILGFVKTWVRKGSDKYEITCISLLKVLNDYQLNTNYMLNNTYDDVNQLQIYYEYKDDRRYSSAPYFAPPDTTTVDHYGKYRILPPIPLIDQRYLPPTYPQFELFTDSYSYGYEAPKIAWRMLQEVGWCRVHYDDILYTYAFDFNVHGNPYQNYCFVNPYQSFTPGVGFVFDEHIMYYSGPAVKFKSFDTDGLRYDYPSEADGVNVTYNQTYYKSFDPSKQSLLYNLKTLAESDGCYLTATFCPRFVPISNDPNDDIQTNGFDLVWTYENVYGSINDLKRWGISAGFQPKVMIRKNAAQLFDFPILTQTEIDSIFESGSAVLIGTLSYGEFDSDPLSDIGAQALSKRINWQLDQTDVVNELMIKYGQGSTDYGSYIELPSAEILEDYFIVQFTGEVSDGRALLNIQIMYKNDSNTTSYYRISKFYPTGATAISIVNDITNSYDGTGSFEFINAGNTILMIPTSSLGGTYTKSFWAANYNNKVTPVLTITVNYSATNLTSLGFSKTFIQEEPLGFQMARDSAKLNGIKAIKVSLPEVKTVEDVIQISDKIFRKLSRAKYRCIVECNDTGPETNWQLPLFNGLFHVVDHSNTKRVINTDGAQLVFYIDGTPASTIGRNSYIRFQFPTPYAMLPIGMSVRYIAQSVDELLDAVKNGIDAYNYSFIDSIVVNYVSNSVTITYDPEAVSNIDFQSTNVFNYANISTDIDGVFTDRIVNPPSQFKQVEYNEYLPLLTYDADSTKGTHKCTFGLPSEEFANVVVQATGWIADVEKSQ